MTEDHSPDFSGIKAGSAHARNRKVRRGRQGKVQLSPLLWGRLSFSSGCCRFWDRSSRPYILPSSHPTQERVLFRNLYVLLMSGSRTSPHTSPCGQGTAASRVPRSTLRSWLRRFAKATRSVSGGPGTFPWEKEGSVNRKSKCLFVGNKTDAHKKNIFSPSLENLEHKLRGNLTVPTAPVPRSIFH